MIHVILDTNVFISGIFWKGPPYTILNAWRQKQIQLVYSSQILEEYSRIARSLSRKYKIDINPFIELIMISGKLQEPIILRHSISYDADDDKFIACALGSNCKIIISGDSDLLDVSGFDGIDIIKPAAFVKKYL